ncbi:Aste57867_11027 [Aphanomyces stellatus]|uniref:Aste57867_11027 protein n=1 Tax=Aphanomyces stellatus TaxID=120398 RepID=A0A485KRT8_9STRA|nr:hypothetical protein As57867_010986 [Aphanomyces stellatus]VFT87895.1 Aste57867_11027 [Aphanomyces stellatus]
MHPLVHVQQQQQWLAHREAMRQRQKQQLRQSIRELQQSTLRDVLHQRNQVMMYDVRSIFESQIVRSRRYQLQDVQQQLELHDQQEKQHTMRDMLGQILHQQKAVQELLQGTTPPAQIMHSTRRELSLSLPQPLPLNIQQPHATTSALAATPSVRVAPSKPPVALPKPELLQSVSNANENVLEPHNPTTVEVNEPQVPSTPRRQPKQQQSSRHEVLFSDDEEKLLAIPVDDSDDVDPVLPTTTTTTEVKPSTDPKRNESLRKKILAQQMPVESDIAKRPKWRIEADAANGIPPPSDEEAPMTPKEMFRAVAFVVLSVVVLQRLALARRRGLRADEAQVMQNMIPVYVEATRVWMAKEVRVPVLSVLQDPTMNFEGFATAPSDKKGLKNKYAGLFARKAAASPEAIVQLKVRLKGLVDAIVKNKHDAPTAIVKFLVKLTSDGVYLPPTYLADEERRGLEFNALGATRNMAHPFDAESPHHSRFNLLVLNFVVVRIVVPLLVLRPWDAGIGNKTKPSAQVQHNLRVLATGLYIVCQRIVPLLPDPGAVIASVDGTTNNNESHALNEISAMLVPKDVLPLQDSAFDAFLNDQQEKLQSWLLHLKQVVQGGTDQIPVAIVVDDNNGPAT